MWRYPYRVETMGRQFPFYEEASLAYYNPGILVHVDDNVYQRNPINFAYSRQYADTYKRYPDYYFNGFREQRRLYLDPYLSNPLTQDDLEDYQPSRKRLKTENGSNSYNSQLNYVTNKQKIYDHQEQQNNETVIKNSPLSEQTLDPMKLSEQLQKYFGKPSPNSQSTNSSNQTRLNHSFTENRDSGLLVEQMKEIYDTLIAKEDPKTSGELWHINEKDCNFTSRSGGGGTCRNCMKVGHSVKNCKNPKKIPLCFICGSDKHEGEVCINIKCSRCLKAGHHPEKCTWHEREWAICRLCKIPGHHFEECPDMWRRYHLTIFTGDIVPQPNQVPNPNKFCYNCADKGHFGHECYENRLDMYCYPSNPFIISYNIQQQTSNSNKNMYV